jgi:prepilin-type N-terminal cleavage/methylation domain-containing protein
MPGKNLRASFTLIELLIVIAVVAVLSVVVVLVLNPAELLKQARDSNRIADMQTLSKALTLYLGDRGGSLGTASTTYLSLIDPTATTTAGTNCAGVGLSAPLGWNYHCAASSTARKLDGTGWIPLNFSAITFSPPFGALPLDPANTSSSGLYYMYVPGTATYAVAATLDSSKYLASKAGGDGGVDPARLEAGSNLALIGQGQGLMGWWPFEDGSGAVATDASGRGDTGTITTGTSSVQWVPGKAGRGLGLDGADDYVGTSMGLSSTTGSISAWVYPTSTNTNSYVFESSMGTNRFYMSWSNTLSCVRGNPATLITVKAAPVTLNTWYHIVCTWDATTVYAYLNGQLVGSGAYTDGAAAQTYLNLGAQVGCGTGGCYFPGIIDEARAYTRKLTAAEVAAMYNSQR